MKNFQVSGARLEGIIKQTTKENAPSNAAKFLNTQLLVPIEKGYKYPNKINWKRAVESFNQYDLTNAQKNMIRRMNIAVAAQPTKGPFEKRRPVKINISSLNRNQAIAAQREALRKENEERQRLERQRENQERRTKRTAPAFKPTGSRATYGMF